MPTASAAERAEPRMVEAAAPAKINLGLRILRRRPDGYHDLDTIFQALDLEDRLTVTRRDGDALTLRVEGDPRVPSGPGNLVLRAARLLRERRAPGRGADLVLEKRIPPGGGLGGGSSDAAAALLALERLWGLDADPAERGRLALDLGSDVPFFLLGGTARGGGRGEALTPLPALPSWPVLLVAPEFGVATAEAYGRAAPPLTVPETRLSMLGQAVGAGDLDGIGRFLVNDLEPGVFSMRPELARLKSMLVALGFGAVGMTGSGSALFALARDDAEADRAWVRLRAPARPIPPERGGEGGREGSPDCGWVDGEDPAGAAPRFRMILARPSGIGARVTREA